jgi:hypothetical protein
MSVVVGAKAVMGKSGVPSGAVETVRKDARADHKAAATANPVVATASGSRG